MSITFSSYFYGVLILLLLLSSIRSRRKTSLALKKAWRMFMVVLPQFLLIVTLVGVLIAVVPPQKIETIIGSTSGLKGVACSAMLGSATVMPVLIAFPLAAELLQRGAGLVQIAVFISTLTTVGLATLPLEMRYLGKKVSLLRNLLALACSVAAGLFMQAVL